MKRILKIFAIGIGVLLLTIFIYERYFLTKWYDFKMGNIEIEVMSDECETCFLDWPINHTIWIKTKNRKNGKFKLYTEGPRLEFGLNKDNSKLLINCPGFSSLYVSLITMEEINTIIEQPNTELDKFTIQWIVKKNKELHKLSRTRKPDTVWDEK